MNNQPSPNRQAFGGLIRSYRRAVGLTQESLGERINLSNSWVSDVENGRLLPSEDQTKQLEGVLDVPENTLEQVRVGVENESHPVGSFESFTVLEDRAAVIFTYDPLVVTGLLQTAEYARALIRGGRPTASGATVEDLVSMRLRRQAILERKEPPTVWAILDELALRRQVGGPEVYHAQLDALIEAAERTYVTVHLVPVDTGNITHLDNSFTIFRFHGAPDVGYSEDRLTGHPYETQDSVQRLWEAWEALRFATLPADASLEIIRRVREETNT